MIQSLLRRGPRYAGVGLACLAINNILLIGLDAAGIHYGYAVIISGLVMIPLSYFLQLRFTFFATPSVVAFARYAMIMMVNTPVAYGLLWIIHDKGNLPMIWAAPITTLLMFIWNYTASNWAVAVRRVRA